MSHPSDIREQRVARTITVNDEESGVTATVVLGRRDDGAQTVREIRFTSENGGLEQGIDLHMLRELGLSGDINLTDPPAPTVPSTVPPAAAPAAVPDPPEPAAAARNGASKGDDKEAGKGASTTRKATRKRRGKPTAKPATSGREYRRAPQAEELQRVIREHGGPTAAARHLNVPLHSVQGWLRRYRSQGYEFA